MAMRQLMLNVLLILMRVVPVIYSSLTIAFYLFCSVLSTKVPVKCAKTNVNQWRVDFHHRFDELSQYDCPGTSCGGQCVALIKCACGAPYTGLWSPGVNVAEHCLHGRGYIAAGSGIATFENGIYNNRWTDHTAVFLGCNNGKIQVIEQACQFGTRYKEYGSGSSLFYKFSVVMVDKLEPGRHCGWRYTGC